MRLNTTSTLVRRFGKSAISALIATLASIGLASAQTPFVISSVSSGQVLDDKAFSTTPGTILQQWPANGGKNQRWNVRRYDNLSYEITSVNSGLALSAQNGSSDSGAKIEQTGMTGAPSQLWYFTRGSSGYLIVSQQVETIPCSGNDCLSGVANLVFDLPDFSTEDGEIIQQWTENGGVNQQWLFHPQDLETITVALNVKSQTLSISGLNFPSGLEVCPVVSSNGIGGEGPCVTTQSNGTFSITWTGPASPGAYYASSPGNLVVTVEDKNRNVLAIDSVPGVLVQNIP